MRAGIFSKIFARPTLAQVLQAVSGHGFHDMQFNMTSAGLTDMPDRIDNDIAGAIGRETAARKIHIAAVSGTYNMVDPDRRARRAGMRRLRAMAEACAAMGTSLITLCTGSRDLENMWRWHPANDGPDAWADLLAEMREAVKIAAACHVVLGVEPEGSNVVADARKARRLLDELGSPNVKIVMDGANLFHDGDFSHQRERMDEAFALLHNDIVLAHAKDLVSVSDGKGSIEWRAAGHGSLDYGHFVKLLVRYGFDGALVLHGLRESQVDGCAAFLRGALGSMDMSHAIL